MQGDVGVREVISTVETAVTSQVCKGEISSSGKGGKAIKGKGKANKKSTELPSHEGTILQFLSHRRIRHRGVYLRHSLNISHQHHPLLCYLTASSEIQRGIQGVHCAILD